MISIYDRQYFETIEETEMQMAERLASILTDMFHPKSVIDLGCATGIYLKPFWEAGVDVYGIDNSAIVEDLSDIPALIEIADLSQDIEITKEDMALCFEVVEHIDKQYEAQVFDNICKASDLVVFSGAIPGQGGEGHINCQPKEYWKARFLERGFFCDEDSTNELLARIKKGYHLGWFTQNAMVFRRNMERQEDREIKDFGKWSIGVEMRRLLSAVVPEGSSILELGSGEATGELAKYYDVTSIEHDPAWLSKYPTYYVHAPLVGDWYDAEAVKKGIEGLQYESLIIDGPIGPASRAAFLEHKDIFKLDCWIFIDDIDRIIDAGMFTTLTEHVLAGRPNAAFADKHGKKFGVIAPEGFANLHWIAEQIGMEICAIHDGKGVHDLGIYSSGPTGYSLTAAWQTAQQHEKAWWGNCLNTAGEEAKQLQYAEKMGLKVVNHSIDMGGRSVLDVGGGPVSLLLKCINVRGKVIDPLLYPDWVKGRYKAAGIEYEEKKAEDMTEQGWDEVWMYNVLTHVEDPVKVVANARQAGSLIRVFEWIDIPSDNAHPHTLRANELDKWFGAKGTIQPLQDRSRQGGSYYGIFPQQKKIVHFVLTTSELRYGYYLAIMSALKTQKADRFILWAFEQPSGKYWPLLKDRVELMQVDFPEIKGVPDKFTREYNILAKNYLEYKALYEHGGIFLDLDTFCLKDITHYLSESQKDMVLAHEVEDHAPSYPFFNISILMSKRHSTLMGEILEKTECAFEQDTIKTGDVSRLVTNIARERLDEIDTIPHGRLGDGGVEKLVNRLAKGDGVLWPQAEVLHCFANNSPFFNKLSEDFVRYNNILFCRIVKETLSEDEYRPTLPHGLPGDDPGLPGDEGDALTLATGEIVSEHGDEGQPGVVVKSYPVTRHKRFHLLGLPHVATNKKEALACAFSQKVIKMARMMKSLGHTVFFYGVEGSEVECDEYIQVSTKDVIRESYGDYDMTKVTYKHSVSSKATHVFNRNAVLEIKNRMQSNDFLLIPFSPPAYSGILQALDTPYIDKEDKLHLVVEMGIGYRFPKCRFKVFESNSQRHYCRGMDAMATGKYVLTDGKTYDAVIPNYFDPDDFEYSSVKQDYFLFLGRIVHRKGIAEAIAAVEAIGAKLVVAGQDGGENVDLSSPNVEYVGFADVKKRKALLRNAKALFLPTRYIEPFGGVIIEANMSGTPVITSNWGAFPELVLHGKTGYRCMTLDDYTWAAQNISNINPADCYKYAMANFSLDRVKWMYEEYFNKLLDVKENVDSKGWKRLHPERTQLDWLSKVY